MRVKVTLQCENANLHGRAPKWVLSTANTNIACPAAKTSRPNAATIGRSLAYGVMKIARYVAAITPSAPASGGQEWTAKRTRGSTTVIRARKAEVEVKHMREADSRASGRMKKVRRGAPSRPVGAAGSGCRKRRRNPSTNTPA